LATDVLVRFEYVDTDSQTPVGSLHVGDDFELQVYVEDVRDARPEGPAGIFKAYFDVDFTPNLASVIGSVGHGVQYNVAASGTTSYDDETVSDWLIYQAGGVTDGEPTPPGDPFLLFSVPFHVHSAGEFILNPKLTDDDFKQVAFTDLIPRVSLERIEFVNTSIAITEPTGPQVSIAATTDGSESGAVAGVFMLTQTEIGSTDTVISYTVAGTAASGSDYTALSGSVRIPAGSTTATIDVPVINDATVEATETVIVRLTGITGGDSDVTIDTDNDEATLQIADNDSAGVSIAQTTNGTEGSAGGRFTITQSATSSTNTIVSYTVGGTATSGSDYTTPSGSVTIPAGQTTAAIDIPVINDALVEANETVIVTLTAITGDDPQISINTAQNAATLQIIDNDTALVRIAGTTNGTEAGPSDAVFTLTQTAVSTSDTVLSYTVGGTATSGVDFTAPSGTVTIAAGATTATVRVPVIDDKRVDAGETVVITLQTVTAGDPQVTIDLANRQASLQIVDDDTAGILITAVAGLETSEAGGIAALRVVLTSEPSAEVVVDPLSSDASEAAVSPGSLTFTPSNWNQPQIVTVLGQDDPQVDGDIAYQVSTAPARSSDPNYAGLAAGGLTLTNLDNDDPGFLITAQTPLTTSESGQSATFTVVLVSQPTATVNVDLVSSDPDEGTVQPATLAFSLANWNVPQTVTINGVDDPAVDGNISYRITAQTRSGDANFNGLTTDDVEVVNTDDDTPAILVSPLAGLGTSEAGASATFQVVLNAPPTADVTVPVASGDTTEGTVSPPSLVFTTSNWSTPQIVTVTGVNDDVADGDVAYSVIVSPATSSDANYNGFDPPDVALTNLDDDTPGIRISPATAGTTTEAGGTATFSVVLSSRPTANVVIGLSSSDSSEGVASAIQLTFAPATWNVPQTVTVTGQDDHRIDGDVAYTIVTAPAASADSGYAGLNAADIPMINVDDDVAGIVVTALNGLETTEGGGMTALSIVLTSEPTAAVVIDVSSSDTSEGTLSPVRLTFTSVNWDQPQVVVVQGQDDPQVDGDVVYTVVTAPAVSSDPDYNGQNAADLIFTNRDDDEPGFLISAQTPLTTSEAGQTATFTVVLVSQPTGTVNIDLSSSDAGEGTVQPATLAFTTANWNTPQTVTIRGVDDEDVDGDVSYHVAAESRSSDPNFNGLTAEDLEVVNVDDDSPAILVTPVTGLTTSEAGASATFEVVLNAPPTADVTVPVASGDTSEGTVSPQSLVFTTSNWSTPQIVTVSGVDDDVADGDVAYSVIVSPATSSDANYNGFDPPDVALTNLDNDTPGIRVFPVTALTTTEAGGAATFSIVLDSRPAADVVIDLASSDASEGIASVTQVTFTPGTWNVPRTITVTGQDDHRVDGDVAYTIVTAAAVSSDPAYAGWSVADVSLTNIDDDVAGILVTALNGLETTEGGGMTALSIVLTSEPAADVVINVSSSDTSEGTLSPVRLTFTSVNWDQSQVVTVQGQDDPQVDGDVVYTVVTAPAVSSDPDYNGRDAQDLTLTNRDDDEAGFEIAAQTPLTTSESGQSAAFTVVLVSQPTATVHIDLSSSDTGEGTLQPATLAFTTANWDIAQTVTLSGVDDQEVDGDISYHIAAEARSSDLNFDGLASDDLEAINRDDDAPAIQVTPVTGLTTSETGQSATFQVVLNAPPTADVTVGISSSDASEGGVSLQTLIFTSTNWATPQVVTVTGVDDDDIDGNIDYTIVLSPATSSDPNYGGFDPPDVALTNLDNDTAGIRIIPSGGSSTTEAGGAVDLSVTLNSRPTADVVVAWTSSDETEGTVAAGSFTFTAENWNIPQVLTVQGVGDAVVDGNVPYAVVATASSGDSHYGSLGPVEAALTNQDDDSAVVTISAADPVVEEGTGGSNTVATFRVTLSGTVEGGFTFNYLLEDGTATTAGGDYLGSGGSVTFAGTDGETHSVTIEINPDNLVEPDETFSVVAAALSEISASAAERIDKEGSPLVFTIFDDDDFTISFSGVSLPEGTGDANTSLDFEVALSNPVQGGLRIVYTTSDGTATLADGDYLDNDGVLEFTGSEPRFIRVEIPQDAKVERDETLVVSLDEIVFLDPALAEIFDVEGGTRTGTILNDDTATISFVGASSVALESAGSHEVEVKLSVANGGTLSEDVTVNLTVDPSSTALAPDDYALSGTSVTFAAGSADGAIRRITIAAVADDVDESDELIRLGLALAGDGIGGAVTAASPDVHDVTLTEDPMTAGVSGRVWFDANNNGLREEGEIGIPGVTVTLSGADLRGQVVAIVVMTDADGVYRFEQVPAGTYSVQETQPRAFVDGIDVLGTIDGVAAGIAGDDRFSNIILAPDKQAVDYNFGERSLARTPVSPRFFLASTPPLQQTIREVVARAEELAGDAARAEMIRGGEAPEVRRIGSRVEFLGTTFSDAFLFVPAGNPLSPSAAEHLVRANGIDWTFDAAEVRTFAINGSSGNDTLELRDSPGSDLLESAGNRLTLIGDASRFDALAIEVARAISSAGGEDRVEQEAIDFVLELEGSWISE